MEDYVKTGEDQKFEYYRNISEVLSGDGEEQPYEEIINKKDEFYIKINNNEIAIKKRSLSKIMILSDSVPEEQILFSLYTTMTQAQSLDRIKKRPISNDSLRPKNPNDLDSLRNSKAVSFPNMVSKEKPNNDNLEPKKNENNKISLNVKDPLSEGIPINNNINNNTNTNEPNLNENVINIPINDSSDNEDVAFQKVTDYNIKDKENNILIVSLPSQAIKIKWFYLLLSLVGICYIVLFIVGLADDKVGFMFNIFCMCIIGVFLLFTGIFGFTKINNSVYDNPILLIFTIMCSIFAILGIIIIVVNEKTKPYLACSIIFGILNFIFALLCIFWTFKLKNNQEISKNKQMESLMDNKN